MWDKIDREMTSICYAWLSLNIIILQIVALLNMTFFYIFYPCLTFYFIIEDLFSNPYLSVLFHKYKIFDIHLSSTMIKLAFTAARRNLNTLISATFALPKHELLSMPALSPTMKQGKIIKWLVKEGDRVQPGDAIAEVETDKATVAFEVQEKGFIAKINASDDLIPIGTPVAVLIKKSDQISQFSTFKFGEGSAPTEAPKAEPPKQQSQPTKPSSDAPSKSYPNHTFLQMPAVSPTMNEGKILKWKIQQGESFGVGDALFSIQTDKAVVDYEATEKGVLAKVIVNDNEMLPIGKNVAVIVKNKDFVSNFSDFKEGQASSQSTQAPKSAHSSSATTKEAQAVKTQVLNTPRSSGDRVVASPIAKYIANEKGIDLSQVSGTGPGGRILKQDVESFTPKKIQKPVETVIVQQSVKVEQKVEKKAPKKGFVVPENPFEDLPLSNMRKTIASRLTESKQNIPHYYVSTSVEMGNVNELRNELNKHQKENGVKISVNDIIIKAMALGLRDYPNANVQWHGTAIRKFRHADVSVAVATEGGLITPIVFKADTLGLLDIARRTKDIAKRAREGKLDPSEYIGGTTTVSNLGMFGINTVTSIINPPQATILGVGKTEKKIVFAEGSQPYRVAEIMQVIASCDHRAVDGALAAQWLNRVKFYLENPTHMLL